MEGFGFSDASSAVRKRRNTGRRPKNEPQLPHENHDNISSLSSTPPSDTNHSGGFGESDEASNNDSYRGSNDLRLKGDDSKRCSEGVLSPANWKSTNSFSNLGVASGVGEYENKVKKVKLKVGGITRTINTKTASDGASAVGSTSTKSSHYPGSRQKSVEDENRSYTSYKDLRGAPWMNISDGGPSVGIGEKSRSLMPGDSISGKQTDVSEPVRKSKRVTKKRSLDGDVGEDDDEIRYLEKVKRSKAIVDCVVDYEDEEGKSRKHQKISKVLKRNVDGLYSTRVDHGTLKSVKEVKKSNLAQESEGVDYLEEEETCSDGEPASKKKKLKKELIDILEPSKKETTITTRQRGRDASSVHGASIIEFPNGLPPAPPKKQKEKLTEMEQQLKRAEALQRRRMQVEKANRESEAEAIRKILGQDSSRKKREVKLKKKQEEMQLEKAANAMVIDQDRVRWIFGPSGTIVIFPFELGMPSIFDPRPCSYPPPREKCASPSCCNPYKYRDSMYNLPLCSLQCYKALQEQVHARTAALPRIRALDYAEDDFEP